MIVTLWIINILLALAMLFVGGGKLVQPKAALIARGMTAFENFSPASVKAIGVVEVLGALGLVLPLVTRIAVVLAPVAAVGLVLMMVVAGIVHARRREGILPPVVLAVVSAASAVIGFAVIGN